MGGWFRLDVFLLEMCLKGFILVVVIYFVCIDCRGVDFEFVIIVKIVYLFIFD